MKWFASAAAALLAVLLPSIADARSRPDIDPAVWVVRDADTTIYMFGTFHLLDGKSDWFNDEVRTAFDAAQEVTLEAIMPDDPRALQAMVMKYGIDPSGRTLPERLGPATSAKLDKALIAAGVDPRSFDRFKPWFAATALTSLSVERHGLTGAAGPEAAIKQTALGSGKKIGELEGVEKQLAIFDRLPQAEQVKYLEQTLDENKDLDKQLPVLLKAWGNGNTSKLAAMLNAGLKKTPAIYKAMFVDRNAAWTDWIVRRLDQPGTVFLAVGAGHFAGKDSVLDMLARRGFKWKRFKG
jgi:uncharacterized protein YbaP (TraB family)